MPNPPTPNMNLVTPVDHGDSDVWGALIDTAFGVVDTHDHSTGNGVAIPAAALNINADVSFTSAGSAHALTDTKAVDMAPQAAASVSAYSSALFTNSDDANNLYFRNASGANVKITSGSTINVSVVGGIGGDYATVGALVSFDDASDSYWFQQQGSPRPWAGMRIGALDVYQQAASISTRVRIQSPTSLAASYALTLPPSITAGAALQSDGSGVLSWSNSFTGAVTSTGVVTGTAVKATAGRTISIHAASAQPGAGWTGSFNGNAWLPGTSVVAVNYPITLPFQAGVTTNIISWQVYIRKTSASGQISATLSYYDQAGTVTSVNPGTINSASGALGYTHLGATAGVVAAALGRQYYIQVTGGGTTGDEFSGAEFTYADA